MICSENLLKATASAFLFAAIAHIAYSVGTPQDQFIVEIRTDLETQELRSELSDYSVERMLTGDQEFDCYLPNPDTKVVTGKEQEAQQRKQRCFRALREIAGDECFIHIVDKRRFKVCPGLSVYETTLSEGDTDFTSFHYLNHRDELRQSHGAFDDGKRREGKNSDEGFWTKRVRARLNRMVGTDGRVYVQIFAAPRDATDTSRPRELQIRFMCDLSPRKKPFETLQLQDIVGGDTPSTVLWVAVHAPGHAFCRQTVSSQELLYSLNTTCLTLPAGWWTYELCFGKHLRQFHMEGKAFTEYILGLPKSQGFEVMDQVTSPALMLQYDRGTKCDLTGMPRSTTVTIKCGKRTALTQVVEQSTCTYEARVTSAEVCVHPLFEDHNPTEHEAKKIYCVPHLQLEG